MLSKILRLTSSRLARFQTRAFTAETSESSSGAIAESATKLRLLTKEAGSSLSTIRDLIRFCTTRLTKSSAFFGHGTDDPYEEAIFLISHATRLTPTVLEPLADAKLTPSEVNEVLELLSARIQQRIPAAYLANTAVLSEKMFYVDKRVIVPRSYISEVLREGLQPYVEDASEVKSVLDMCTGSGCLAILASDAFPNARVVGVDASAGALEVAARNVADHGLQQRVRLVQSDMFAALKPKQAASLPPQFDVIVSNPPYLKRTDLAALPAEYQHEPTMALDGGADGMDFVRTLLKEAYAFLSDSGVLLVEVGGLRADVERAFPQLPFTWVPTSQSDDMLFLLRKQDFEQLARGRSQSANPNEVADADAEAEEQGNGRFQSALNSITRGASLSADQQNDPALARALNSIQQQQQAARKAAKPRKL